MIKKNIYKTEKLVRQIRFKKFVHLAEVFLKYFVGSNSSVDFVLNNINFSIKAKVYIYIYINIIQIVQTNVSNWN